MPIGWDLLGLAGFAFFIAGGMDFAFAWWPSRFGNPEWEFGTVTASMNAMPAGLLGLTLMLVRAIMVESPGWTRLFSVLLLVWAVVVVGIALLYGLTLPIAARGFADPAVGLGLKRAIGRTLVQLATYTIVLFWMGVRGLKASRTMAV